MTDTDLLARLPELREIAERLRATGEALREAAGRYNGYSSIQREIKQARDAFSKAFDDYTAAFTEPTVLALLRIVEEQQEDLKALAKALERCARGWGWWNPGDPPIVADLPDHPAVRAVIDRVRREERARYAEDRGERRGT